MDKFQSRYIEHQARKKEALAGKYEKEVTYSKKEQDILRRIFKNRHSSRIFNGDNVNLDYVLELVKTSPSSCDRQAVGYVIIDDREDKEILSGLLVGGVGWVHRADKIVLLFADMDAYKSPAEKDFMPYLDAGTMIQSFYLASEVMGIKCCYVNPNIRERNKLFFNNRFNIDGKLYCGAIILGK